jgi:hypothetical protein
MKQQQAGIIEAKAAIRRADESVLQGRSIVVFTVFTIFFVNNPIELRSLILILFSSRCPSLRLFSE